MKKNACILISAKTQKTTVLDNKIFEVLANVEK